MASRAGSRYQVEGSPVFNRASVNVSGVHYEDKDKYPIDSATALSVILHPRHPKAPSMHFHISYVKIVVKRLFTIFTERLLKDAGMIILY